MEKILVSACLLGEPVRYNAEKLSIHPCGLNECLQRWQQEMRLISVCPEVAGGLPTPRPPAEIEGGQGAAVLRLETRVVNVNGVDVTAAFRSGANVALALVQQHQIHFALLKANSPSCGNEHTYNGRFNGGKVLGQGVTAALLQEAGVQVFNEYQWRDLVQALEQRDQSKQD